MAGKKKKEVILKNDVERRGESTADHQAVTKKRISGKSDKISGVKKKRKRRKKTEPVAEVHPLEKFGSIRKSFILEHIRTINYRDMAKLLGIKSDELERAMEKMGIKLPIDCAKEWSEIDLGQYRSLTICARCQVQRNHSTFFVGINNCRKCFERNIKHWVKENVAICLRFSDE